MPQLRQLIVRMIMLTKIARQLYPMVNAVEEIELRDMLNIKFEIKSKEGV